MIFVKKIILIHDRVLCTRGQKTQEDHVKRSWLKSFQCNIPSALQLFFVFLLTHFFFFREIEEEEKNIVKF